mgnify:FL=1
MPDIKTRDVVSSTIKTIDRSALAGQRMKDAYVQAKDKAEHSVYSSESNSEEYASERITDGVSTVAREAIHQVDVQGHRIIHGAQRKFTQRQENPQPQQSPPQSTSGSPQSSPNTPASISPQQVQNSPGTEDIHHAQQPHRVSPDGAASSGMGGHSKVGSGTSIPKQEAVHQQQIAFAKAELRAKRASQQMVSSVPKAPGEGKVFHSHQVPTTKATATRQTVKSVESITIKTSGRTIKTAGSTVKTVEHMGGTAIKSTQAAAETAQKTAMIATQSAHRSRVAARAVAAAAKKTAEYTARAAKAIAQAMQELISVAAAGGGTVLILVIVLIVMCFAGMMLASDENDTEILPVSEEVKAYEPIIQKYAKEHGIPDYVLLIEAVMMQESGGRGTDPMQCSECNFNTLYPHTPGSITDPEYSVNVGIQNLADCLQIAQCEGPVDIDAIKLALQGYNYGQGYITWAMRKYGEYSKGNAIEFSLKTAEQYGWSSYGDMDYVPHVLRYYPLGQIFYDPDTTQLIVEVAASQIGNVGGEPYWSWYGFTERVEWCACFVSWCANKCGYLDTFIPKFAGCSTGVQWFKARNQWADRTTTPEPGMIVFFDWDRDGVPDHTGIVEKIENGYVYTIEGNTSDSCRRQQYTVGNPNIFGYGTPAY